MSYTYNTWRRALNWQAALLFPGILSSIINVTSPYKVWLSYYPQTIIDAATWLTCDYMTVTILVFEEEPIQDLRFEAVNFFKTFLKVTLYSESLNHTSSHYLCINTLGSTQSVNSEFSFPSQNCCLCSDCEKTSAREVLGNLSNRQALQARWLTTEEVGEPEAKTVRFIILKFEYMAYNY